MITINLDAEEVNILLQSIKHCLNTCKEGGHDHGCPDCDKLHHVMVKIQAEVGKLRQKDSIHN